MIDMLEKQVPIRNVVEDCMEREYQRLTGIVGDYLKDMHEGRFTA